MTSKTLLFSFLFCFSINASSQSPWVNKKGSIYEQIGLTFLGYESVINDSVNKLVPVGAKTRDITANLYTDYALSNNMAVLVSLPFKVVQHNNQSLSSLGDPTIKLKYQFSKKTPFAGYIGYTAPFSRRVGVLRTGYNQHAAEGGISLGKGKERYFIYGGLGYRLRTNISNQILVEFEFGRKYLIAKKRKPLYLIFRVDGMFNTSDTKDLEAGLANLYHNNGEFLSPALKFSFNLINNFWINGGVHSAVFVRNFGASSTFNLGVAYNLNK